LNESKDIGEGALDSALAWDTISSAKFEPLNLVQPYLPALRDLSSKRVALDPEYSYVREDIELYKNNRRTRPFRSTKRSASRKRTRMKRAKKVATRNGSLANRRWTRCTN